MGVKILASLFPNENCEGSVVAQSLDICFGFHLNAVKEFRVTRILTASKHEVLYNYIYGNASSGIKPGES